MDVIRSIDEIFALSNIYGPHMVEIAPGKYAGDVSDGEWLYFRWNQEGLVGISFDEHVFDSLDALAKEVKNIHNEFKNKQKNATIIHDDEYILPDRIIILGDY